MQLVNDRVQQKKETSHDAALMNVDAVRDQFKVLPTQMRDYLCLVGNKSDNIVGAAGIEGVRAAALLSAYHAVYDAFDKGATAEPLRPRSGHRCRSCGRGSERQHASSFLTR